MKQSKLFFLIAIVVILGFCAAVADAQNEKSVSPRNSDGEQIPVMQDFEAIGHLGGRYDSLALNGSYAYAGVGPELQVIDIADPADLNQIGTLLLDAQIASIHIAGNYVYLGTWQKGLRIVDITIPDTPVLVGSVEFPGIGSDIAVSGSYAYVIVAQGLQIVNISDSTAPTVVSLFEIQYARYVAVAYHNHLYAAASGKLVVIDISDPENPVLVRTLFLAVFDLFIAGDYLYVTITDNPTQYGGLIIFDLSDPALPTEAGRYLAHWNAIDYGNVRVAGDYAFLGGEFLTVLDVSNPAKPVWIERHYEFGRNHVEVGADKLYLSYHEAIQVVDVTDPLDPFLVSKYEVTPLYYVSFMAVDEYAYTPAVINISDSSKPAFVSDFPTISWADNIYGLAKQGNYLYTAANFCVVQCWSELAVVDISDPISPTLAGLSGSSDKRRFFQVEVAGQYAYGHGQDALVIFDVSDATAPSIKGVFSYTVPYIGPSYDFAVSGGYAFIIWGHYEETEGLLQVIDVADPAEPSLVGSYSTSLGLVAVDVLDQYAFIVDSSSNGGKLSILDISDPSAIVEVSSYRFPWYEQVPGHTQKIAVVGPYLYLLSASFVEESSSLRLVNISDLANPIEVGSYPIPGYGEEFQVVEDYVYVAGGYSGFYIVQHSPVQVALTSGYTASLSYDDYQGLPTTFDFPAASVTEPITIAVSSSAVEDTAGFSFARHTFQLVALEGETALPNFSFATPVTITIRYSPDDVGAISNEEGLALWVWTDEGWQDATTTCDVPDPYGRDIVNNVLTLTICETGRFALFGPTHQRYLPFIERH